MDDVMKSRALLIWFGKNGYGVHLKSFEGKDVYYSFYIKSSLAAFESNLFYINTPLSKNCILDKCPILDKREVIKNNKELIFESPVCSPDLKSNEVEVQKGINHEILDLTSDVKYPEDYKKDKVTHIVSINDYILWWLQKGSILGKIKYGMIQWLNKRNYSGLLY